MANRSIKNKIIIFYQQSKLKLVVLLILLLEILFVYLTYLESFQNTAKGTKLGGRIGQLETPERFRWLTAVRSSVLQTSRPHAGLCEDLDVTFEKLFSELVL